MNKTKEQVALLSLSPTERRIFDLWITGMATGKIAKTIKVRPESVTGYKRKILDKLHLANSMDVVLFAVRQDLIGPNSLAGV